jgi:DNA (cytosine-5)-methyltransferase 1
MIRELRERAGLSQAELAAAVGYTDRQVRRWECGDAGPHQVVTTYLQQQIEASRSSVPQEPKHFRFVDLFAGIGGLRRGFEVVGGECVFTCEWDKYAQQTYRANFPHDLHEIRGNIRDVKPGETPAHDVLLAGFPCQPFSIAGVSKKNALGRPHGFECETQGTLFYEVERIIAECRPKAFLLENVKNLVSHDGGNTFRVIMHTLREKLGYTVYWKVIDAKSFVPQHRERTIIVGFREPTEFDWAVDVEIPDPKEGPRLGSILHPEDGSEAIEERFVDRGGHVLDKYVLTPHLWTYLQNYAEKHRAKGNGFGFGLVGPEDVTRTLSARYYKDGSEILVRTAGDRPRRLTPRECARLMGFDAPGKPPMKIPVSDTQAYRQFGNSVVVPVVTAVAKAVSDILRGDTRDRQLNLQLAQQAA